MKKYKLPVIAFLVATAVTSVMDFTGLINYSALPLILITLVFWWIFRLSRKEIGLQWGILKYHGIAVLYPIVVLGMITLLAAITGNIMIPDIDWERSIKFIGLASVAGIVIGLLTEEGFFRGWLWGTFKKLGMSAHQTLWITSLFFMLWHISAVTSATEYGLPWKQIPIYLVNATLLGLIWGLIRSMSGSILVASVSHAVWNGFTYQLFGFGTKTGDLGITNTIIFGPEIGILGIVFNGLFFWWLYHKWETQE